MANAISNQGANLIPSKDGSAYVWSPKRAYPPAVIEEAKNAIGPRRAYLQAADAGDVALWLAKLGDFCAAQQASVSTQAARKKAYAQMLRDRPAICFTEKTLAEAAKKFSFYPSLAELSAFFDDIEKPYHERLRRLERVSRARPDDSAAVDEETAIRNRQTIGRMMGHWKELLAGKITADEYKARVAAERTNPNA